MSSENTKLCNSHIRQHMFLKDTDITVVSAAVTVVLMDVKTGKAVPLEGDLLTMMQGG